jgi:hypothetical protein
VTRQRSFLDPLLGPAAAGFALRNTVTGVVLTASIETVFGLRSWRRGLAGRTGIPPGHAVVLVPCGAVHTFGIEFGMDVVFVDAHGLVRKVCRHLPPRRVVLSLGAHAALLFTQGGVAYSGALPGDLLELLPLDAALSAGHLMTATRWPVVDVPGTKGGPRRAGLRVLPPLR